MHLTEAEILLYLEDKLNADASERMKSHFSECRQCRDQLVILLRLPQQIESAVVQEIDGDFLKRAQRLVPPAGSAGLGFHLGVFAKPVLALSIVLIVGLAYLLLKPPGDSVFRDRKPVPSSMLMLPSEGAVIKQAFPTFRWSAVKNSVGYRITVYRENGTILWQGTSTDTSCAPPGDVVFQAENIYLWRVETYLPDRSNNESRLQSFVYSPSMPSR